jgi:type II secretory pathway component PulF
MLTAAAATLLHHPLIAELRDFWNRATRTQVLKDDKRALLYYNLSQHMANGSSIKNAVTKSLKAASRNGTRVNAPQARALAAWLGVLRTKPLSEAVRGWVPPLEAMLIAAAEKNGRLQSAFAQLHELIFAGKRMNDAVRKALYAPGIIASVGIIAFMIGSRALLTKFHLSGFEPMSDTMLIAVYEGTSNFLWSYADILALMPFLIVALVRHAKTNLKGRSRIVIDRHWPFSIFRRKSGIAHLAAMAFLTEANHSAKQALNILIPHASPYEKERLVAFRNRMNEGKSYGEALVTSGCGSMPFGYPDIDLNDNIADLCNGGSLSGPLKMLVTYSTNTSIAEIENLAVRLNTYATIFAAAWVGFQIVGFLAIIYRQPL